jgi:hypothetical protein
MHHDPLRSTQKRPFFSFGHSWVVFSLHVSFPFAPGKSGRCPSSCGCTANGKNRNWRPVAMESRK